MATATNGNGDNFWFKVLDKYGMPTVIATFLGILLWSVVGRLVESHDAYLKAESKNSAENTAILGELKDMQKHNAMVMADVANKQGRTIELLEAQVDMLRHAKNQ